MLISLTFLVSIWASSIKVWTS